MKEITAFKFTYTPFDRSYPIRFVDVHIIAETRKEAEMIAMDKKWTFFNQDCHCEVIEILKGYSQE